MIINRLLLKRACRDSYRDASDQETDDEVLAGPAGRRSGRPVGRKRKLVADSQELGCLPQWGSDSKKYMQAIQDQQEVMER